VDYCLVPLVSYIYTGGKIKSLIGHGDIRILESARTVRCRTPCWIKLPCRIRISVLYEEAEDGRRWLWLSSRSSAGTSWIVLKPSVLLRSLHPLVGLNFVSFPWTCKPHGFCVFLWLLAVYHPLMVEAGTLFHYLKKRGSRQQVQKSSKLHGTQIQFFWENNTQIELVVIIIYYNKYYTYRPLYGPLNLGPTPNTWWNRLLDLIFFFLEFLNCSRV